MFIDIALSELQSAKKEMQQMDFGMSFRTLELFMICTFGTDHNLSMNSECDYWSRTRSPLGQDLGFVV